MRRRHQIVIDCQRAASRHHVYHVHEQVVGNAHQNVRLVQRSQLRGLRHLVDHNTAIAPNLLFTSPHNPHRHLLLEKRPEFVHVGNHPEFVRPVLLVGDVQHDRRLRHGESLVIAVVVVSGDSARVRLVQIQVNRALVRVTDQRGDGLVVTKRGDPNELAEAGESGRQVVLVEHVEGLLGRVEVLEDGDVLVRVGHRGLGEEGEEDTEHLRWRE